MAIEIERKFWVNSMVFQTLKPLKCYSISQGYLSDAPDRTVRVRLKGNDKVNARITIKGKTVGCSRKEYEYDIPYDEGVELLGMCPTVVSKNRYIVPVEELIPGVGTGLKYEIDVFEKDNQGLVIAEIELHSEDQTFIKPSWLGEEIDPDSDMYKKVSNSSLATHPLSKWTAKEKSNIKGYVNIS